MAQVVAPTFEIRNEAGELITTGQVGGESVALPPGDYTVVIRTNPEIIIDAVLVNPEEVTTVVATQP